VNDAWAAYSMLMGVRRDTYMRTDTEGENQQAQARARRRAAGPAEPGGGRPDGGRPGGYEGVALQVIDGLTGRRPGEVIVNTRNGASLAFLDPDDVVEVPALVHGGGVSPLAAGTLPRSARGLITQTKQYERELVDAAVSGDAGLAALALALHPLVPGVTVAREMMSEYRERHGPHLAYLH
jgi:6-phospho-beta-glucosidase